jgi:hypothetical protein
VILPRGPFDGIDDPAKRDAPGMILLAFGKRCAQPVLGRKNLAAKLDRVGRIRTQKVVRDADVGHQILGG